VTHEQRYDALIIGDGQAGGPLSTALAAAGRRTAVIEREHAGGTCVNVGCTPTKTMVASARVAYLARRSADYGVQTGPVSVDMVRVRQRKRAIVESLRSGSQQAVERDGEPRVLDLDLATPSSRWLWTPAVMRCAPSSPYASYAAQHESFATSRSKVWAASFSPSLMVRYGAKVSVRSFTVRWNFTARTPA
jgi:choline dehydrogenase-like flavoprotein